MKRLIVIILGCIFNSVFSQDNDCIWFKRLGNVLDEQRYNSFQVVDENGFIFLSGYLTQYSQIDYDTTHYFKGFYISKYDSVGNKIWLKRLSQNLSYTIVTNLKYKNGFIYTSGMYIDTVTIGNDTLPITDYNNPYYLISKWDTSGNLIWFKSIPQHECNPPGPAIDRRLPLFGIDIDNNDNILVFGNFSLDITFDSITIYNNYHPYIRYPFFAKLDFYGNTQWVRYIKIQSEVITLNYQSILNAACFDSDNNIISVISLGDSNIIFNNPDLTYNKGSNFVKINSDGELLLNKEIPDLHFFSDGKIIHTNQNESFFCSNRTVFQDSQYCYPSYCIIKFSNSGDILNLDTNYYRVAIFMYSYINMLYDVDLNEIIINFSNSSSHCIIHGDTFNDVNGSLFMKYDSQLILKSVIIKKAVSINSISKYSGNIYFTGLFANYYNCNGTIVNSNHVNGNNFLLKQKDIFNNINKNFSKDFLSIYVYPNPASDILLVKWSFTNFSFAQAEIFNLQGERVLTHNISLDNTSINVTKLPAGLYFLRATDNEKNTIVKFVKE